MNAENLAKKLNGINRRNGFDKAYVYENENGTQLYQKTPMDS